MCGIIGAVNLQNLQIARFIEGMKAISYRGRDAVGIFNEGALISQPLHSGSAVEGVLKHLFKTIRKGLSENSGFVIGHLLHSIVGDAPQPIVIEEDSSTFVLAANCEIYNWRELAEENSIKAENDAWLLAKLLVKKKAFSPERINRVLSSLDGVYSFVFATPENVFLARDILGQKPLWFFFDGNMKAATKLQGESGGIAFASEKKALLKMGMKEAVELNPRIILDYSLKERTLEMFNRGFLSPGSTASSNDSFRKGGLNQDALIKKAQGLLINAVSKRLPDMKLGLLMSGGVDSAAIALILKKLGVPFSCYITYYSDSDNKKDKKKQDVNNVNNDVVFARKMADYLEVELIEKRLSLRDVEELLPEVVDTIEDTQAVKVSVALTMFASMMEMKKAGIKVVFSGLGSEEIFAGYTRHMLSDISVLDKESVAGLRRMYERDLYRDDTCSMMNGLELRLPFLDKELVNFAIALDGRLKINRGVNKYILREAIFRMGLPREIAFRKKVSAQYGSRVDRAVDMLSKKKGLPRSAFLESLLPGSKPPLGVLFSGGKDSVLAMHIMGLQLYSIKCLISVESRNKDSYMFHTPAINLIPLQSAALGVPSLRAFTAGKKEEELDDLKGVVARAVAEFKIQGIVTGALFSTYQRDRIEELADALNLKVFSPLWLMDQSNELKMVIRQGFRAVIVRVAAMGLDKSLLGRVIDEEVYNLLKEANRKYKVNIAGEGGEFETIVVDGPIFNKRINIDEYEIVEDDGLFEMVVKRASLNEKKD